MPTKIQNDLFNMRDEKFAHFNASLMPTTDPKKTIGVRTPDLRKYAKTIKDSEKFLSELPHKYLEENQIHAFILSDIRDIKKCISLVDAFLPYIDNWAVCDQLIPKIFAKNTDALLPQIRKWIKSKHIYTVRFAIGLLMRFYLDKKFDTEYANTVAKIKSDEYYINMMRAWYFATALAKNWDDTISIIENKKLDIWTHNKTIQKARESFRISDEQKEYLRKLKI